MKTTDRRVLVTGAAASTSGGPDRADPGAVDDVLRPRPAALRAAVSGHDSI